MNRTTLRYFVTVVQLGSIRQAAEQLNVAQSAISRQIMRLEEDLGVPLLDRRNWSTRCEDRPTA
jgi:DNA-binding transcriptional LysR family regulator